MPVEILMPALSPTMTEGTLAKWLKSEGDAIKSGDAIAEIETDKATMEVEAVEEGTLGKILVAEGTEGVAVNAVIALLLEDGEDASALEGASREGGKRVSSGARQRGKRRERRRQEVREAGRFRTRQAEEAGAARARMGRRDDDSDRA